MKARFDNAYVLNVMAEDRPGIVAAVSRRVSDAGGNIDACSQTVLAGYFTLIMIVSFPAPLAEGPFLQALACPNGRETGFQVQVRPFRLEAERPVVPDADNFVVTCFGPDAPGVIYRFSALLADKGINIVDLYGQLDGGQFMLVSQVQIPRKWDLAMLQADLEQLGAEQNYTVRLQHENIFIATNQLRLGRLEVRDAR
jgi:glycine cleavage system transcriptional repressor